MRDPCPPAYEIGVSHDVSTILGIVRFEMAVIKTEDPAILVSDTMDHESGVEALVKQHKIKSEKLGLWHRAIPGNTLGNGWVEW